jgi:hypothetical protein
MRRLILRCFLQKQMQQQKPGKKIKKLLVEALKDPKVQGLVCCPYRSCRELKPFFSQKKVALRA